MRNEEMRVIEKAALNLVKDFFRIMTSDCGKERKKRGEKKKSPHTPLIKEKQPEKIEKENIYMAAGANSDFEKRLEAFRQECLRFVTKDNEQRVADFFNHYSQPSKRGKMLFEGKRYWDTEKRLKLWMNRSYNVENSAAAERLERLKKKAPEPEPNREREREQLEQEIAERKRNAVSYEEYLAMKKAKDGEGV